MRFFGQYRYMHEAKTAYRCFRTMVTPCAKKPLIISIRMAQELRISWAWLLLTCLQSNVKASVPTSLYRLGKDFF